MCIKSNLTGCAYDALALLEGKFVHSTSCCMHGRDDRDRSKIYFCIYTHTYISWIQNPELSHSYYNNSFISLKIYLFSYLVLWLIQSESTFVYKCIPALHLKVVGNNRCDFFGMQMWSNCRYTHTHTNSEPSSQN